MTDEKTELMKLQVFAGVNDRPCICLARDEEGNKYLCHLYAENAGIEMFLAAMVSDVKLKEFLAGQVDLLSAFQNPDGGFLYACSGKPTRDGGMSLSTRRILPSHASGSWFPSEEIFIAPILAAMLAKHVERNKEMTDSHLPKRLIAMARKRNWDFRWPTRSAYLHLESSELTEAVRGKAGDPLCEAADVLITLMLFTESAGIQWNSVVRQAWNRCAELEILPRYPNEAVKDDKP